MNTVQSTTQPDSSSLRKPSIEQSAPGPGNRKNDQPPAKSSRPSKLSQFAFAPYLLMLLIGAPFFNKATVFVGGYSAVERAGKWGIIDTAGHFMVDPQYDVLSGPFKGGIYEATKAGHQSWITPTGVKHEPPGADPVDPAIFRKCGPDGATIISGRDPSGAMVWGLADASGHEIIKPVHRAIRCFKNGVAWVPVDSKRQWCPVRPDGAVRDRPSCIEGRYRFVPSTGTTEQFPDEPYENSVRWTQALLEFGAGLRTTPPEWNGWRNISSPSDIVWP